MRHDVYYQAREPAKARNFLQPCLLSRRPEAGAGCNAALTCYQAARRDPAAASSKDPFMLACSRRAALCASSSRRFGRLGGRGRRQHRHPHHEARQGHDPAPPRLGAQARRADQDAGEAEVLRRHDVPSRHSGLHGADRRSDRHRLGRLEPSQPAGRVQPDPFQARHPRHGARGGSEFRQFAVLHHVRRRRLPRRQIYRLRRGHLGHGRRRQDQGRNRGQQRRGRQSRQDRDHAHGVGAK